MPVSLQQVRDAGLLSSKTEDPYSGKELRYDPAKRRVWSVGTDGSDDGGKFASSFAPREADFGILLRP